MKIETKYNVGDVVRVVDHARSRYSTGYVFLWKKIQRISITVADISDTIEYQFEDGSYEDEGSVIGVRQDKEVLPDDQNTRESVL